MEEPIIRKTTRRRVSSSNIAAIGYYGELSILEVEFLDGSIYHYFDVPESQFEAIIAAPSHGKFLHRNIMGRYRYERVQEARAYRTERRHRRPNANLFRIYACDWCYEMLGVSRTDDIDTVRKAYHKKAHLYHPDKGGDEQDMRRLNEAFELVKEAMGVKGR